MLWALFLHLPGNRWFQEQPEQTSLKIEPRREKLLLDYILNYV